MNQQLAFRSESSEKDKPHDSDDSLSASGSMRGSHFYGWWMLVLAILIMVGTSPGQTFGITFFNAKFRDAFGLGHSQISVSYLVATLCAAILLPFIGRLTDCWGLRRSVLVAVGAMATICICASLIQGWIALFFVYLALRTIGPGTMVLLANNTLAAWFDRRLGLAISLMQLSMAAAMAIIPGLLLLLIEQIGWRETYLLLGGILCCGLLPLLFLHYRSDPKHINQVPDGKLSENHSWEDVAAIGGNQSSGVAVCELLDSPRSRCDLGTDWYGSRFSSCTHCAGKRASGVDGTHGNGRDGNGNGCCTVAWRSIG